MNSVLIIAFGAIGLGFFLIFLLATAEKKQKQRNQSSNLVKETPLFSMEHFQKACILIVEGMKLDVEEADPFGDPIFEMRAKDPRPFTGGKFLIHCLYLAPDESISEAEILEVSKTIIQERLSKGIVITTGKITDQLAAISELAPLDFIDGKKFEELAQKYAPDYCVMRS